MSRQYSNRSYIPSDEHSSTSNSSRRYHQTSPNEFTHFQYPPSHHRQFLPFNRHTTEGSTSHYHRMENPSAASFSRHSPWLNHERDDQSRSTTHHYNHSKRPRSSASHNTSNSQSHRHYERKRSRHNENDHHHYHTYSNHRSTNPSYSRTMNNDSYNRSVPSSHHQSIPSTNTHYHPNGMTFESSSYHPQVFHRTSVSTYMHQQQQPSPSFLLTDLLHRVIDTHAAAYSNNYLQYHHHHPPSASIDLIAYAWMSPSHEVFSLPPVLNIQFGDLFDLTIPDETPVVGLTDSELERLPTMIYSSTCTDLQTNDKCVVCLSEYTTGEKLKRLRCKHYFHSHCIDPWLKTSTRCPICRGEQTN